MEKPVIVSVTLADIYLKQGYIEKSIEILEKLVKKEPNNSFYKKKLSALKKELKEKNKGQGLKRFLNKKVW
jgi:lipopolysaccharide biosynthesis regulator YciM